MKICLNFKNYSPFYLMPGSYFGMVSLLSLCRGAGITRVHVRIQDSIQDKS